MVDIWLFQWLKHAVSHLFVRHKDIVADFHEAAAVAVRVAMLAKFRIVRRTKIIKHFAIWTARVANRRGFWRTVAAPSVFRPVVVENPLAFAHTARVAVRFAANIRRAVR